MARASISGVRLASGGRAELRLTSLFRQRRVCATGMARVMLLGVWKQVC
jgi:hypothetical protein